MMTIPPPPRRPAITATSTGPGSRSWAAVVIASALAASSGGYGVYQASTNDTSAELRELRSAVQIMSLDVRAAREGVADLRERLGRHEVEHGAQESIRVQVEELRSLLRVR